MSNIFHTKVSYFFQITVHSLIAIEWEYFLFRDTRTIYDTKVVDFDIWVTEL